MLKGYGNQEMQLLLQSVHKTCNSISTASHQHMLLLREGMLFSLLWQSCFRGLNAGGLRLDNVCFFFFGWESYSLHIPCTCNERNYKCQKEGHPQPKLQTTLTTSVEADTKVCKEATCQAKQAAYKAVVHQPTAKPVQFQRTNF